MSSIQKTNSEELSKSEEYNKLILTKENIKIDDLFVDGDRLIKITYIGKRDDENDDTIYVTIKVVDLDTLEPISSWTTKGINEFIKEYSHKYVPDFEDYKKKAQEYLYSGKPFEIEEEVKENEFGLVHKTSKIVLETIYNGIDIKKRQLEILRNMTTFLINNQKASLDKIKRKMEEQIAIFSKEMQKIMKVIGMIELYMGIEEELYQLTSGEPAGIDEPLVLRQLVIFADEEVGNCDDGGIDYTQLDKFDEWLIENDRYKDILPEIRGIVALKPRRNDKEYTTDKILNQLMNVWNRQTYFLIRNGDNVYRICSPNIGIGETMFPKKSELEKLNNSSDEHQQEMFNDKYMKMMLFIQGLLDRTEIFEPIQSGIKVTDLENGGLRLIYDAEPSLTDGRLYYAEWVKEINSNVGRGSRIVLSPSWGRNSYNDNDNHYYKYYSQIVEGFVPYYANHYRCPSFPKDGLYTLEEMTTDIYKDGKRIDIKVPVIRYMPDEKVWKSRWDGEQDRKVRITWALSENSTYLNYDRICLDDIEHYLNSRLERKNYLGMLPILRTIKKHLIAEQVKENDFKLMLKGMVMRKYPNMTDSEMDKSVNDAIDWWKYKNIWKRPITQDDKKAVRMIQQKLKI